MDYHRNLAVMANNPHRKRRYQNFATTTTKSCTTTIEVTLTETSSRTSSPLPLTTLATELPILTVNRIENLPSTIFQKCPHTEFVTEIEQKFDEKTAFFTSSSSPPQDTIETTTPSIPTITTKPFMMFSNRWCLCCDSQFTKTISESGFLKFLTRFSGRRRNVLKNCHKLFSTLISLLMLLSLCSVSEACSSRTTPKPRPPPTPSPRPNITFHTYKCPPTYAAWYCLNDATCFTVKIGDEILYNCECADGYMGPRCEYKDLDGSYLPTRPRVMLETASIASGATLALIFVLILCLILYVRCHQRQKLDRLAENGVDTVDGLVHTVRCEHFERRPFGPHHYYTIPMAATLKR